MATKKRATTRRSGKRGKAAASSEATPILYIHGIGDKPPAEALRREWDLALFGREMGERTRMTYWADILHPKTSGSTGSKRIARAGADLNPSALLEAAGVNPKDDEAQAFVEGLLDSVGLRAASRRTKVLPLPGFLRRPVARAFLEALVKDSAAYFFKADIRARIRKRFSDLLPGDDSPVIVVSHSQGTVISLEVLAERAKAGKPVNVEQYVTLGSPLGVREVQDVLTCPREVPKNVARWHNFADPLDYVAIDKGIGNDFRGPPEIVDELIMNSQVRRLEGFNPHSAVGYLAHPKVRRVVQTAAREDIHARFLMARDVAAELAVEQRQSVLIEVLEPGYRAVGETPAEVQKREARDEHGQNDLRGRVVRAGHQVEQIVTDLATERLKKKAEVEAEVSAARIDQLRRFVAARLTPTELMAVAERHRDLRVYAIWKSARKRKLLHRSVRAIQADAARASYGALGARVRWAVLDTGVRRDHPHFERYGNIVEVWDCTKPGPPQPIANDTDRDGHGTHVAGIIAGETPPDTPADAPARRAIAPQAQLVVYKVLDDHGSGEDAWIIKALDHIADHNENQPSTPIHGINLSLGGPYDSTVYGCGFSPICAELRRQWRSGVLVVVASGNEGQTEVTTPDGSVELNTSLSIGDPANLEDCIAVGSVHADRPHLYGVSAFSSRGPTADGRIKPDVVAPGERISSCDARYRSRKPDDLYREESGTSMAAPHVSGLLAAFLSVRPEFRGRPDEVKALLLRTCIDLQRDRYHQGHGLPNLMRMLLEA